jgi:hypothetical protein
MYAGVPRTSPVLVSDSPPASSIARAIPKVGHNRVARLEQDVLWLDVAMEYAGAVRVLKCIGHLAGDLDCIVHRQLGLAIKPSRKLSPSINGIT